MDELMTRAMKAAQSNDLQPTMSDETRDMLIVLIRQYFDAPDTYRAERQRCIEAAKAIGCRSEAIEMIADIDE